MAPNKYGLIVPRTHPLFGGQSYDPNAGAVPPWEALPQSQGLPPQPDPIGLGGFSGSTSGTMGMGAKPPTDRGSPDASVPPPTGGPGGGGAYPGDYGGPAGTPPRIGTLTNKETDTTTTSPELNPGQVATETQRYERERGEIHDQRERAKIKLENDQRELGLNMATQKLKKIGMESTSEWARASVEETRVKFDAARDRFQKLKIDPNRFVKNMTGTQHVLSTIADAMATLAEGLTRGRIKNNTGKMLQMAIDRDIAAQRSNMASQLQALKLSEGQMKTAWGKWRAHEGDLRKAGLDLAVMNLGAKAAQAKGVAQIEAYRMAISKLDKERNRLDSDPKVVTKVKVKKKQAVIAGTGRYADPNKLTQMKDPVKKSFIDGAATRHMLEKLGSRLEAGKGMSAAGLIKMKLWWTKNKFTESQRQALALKMSRDWNGGRPTDQDTKRIVGLIPGPGDTWDMARKKIRYLRDIHNHRMRTAMSFYPSGKYDTRALERLWGKSKRTTSRASSLSRLRKKSAR